MKPARQPIASAAQLALTGRTTRTRGGGVTAQWYDGSRWSPNRSYVWQPVQSARRDLDRFTRTELNRSAEMLWKNSPLIRATVKRLVTLIIGVGAFPSPKSSSPEFNKELKNFLKAKFRSPCVDNKKSFANYQRKKMTALVKAGESFTVFTHDERTLQDKIQGFEWYRCTALGGQPTDPNNSSIADTQAGGDGIDFYENGYPKAYRFTGMDAPVPENLVVHHAIIERDDQVRGETLFAACINTARDVKDILDLEKQAVKDASSKQDIIQTMSGEYDPETMNKLPFGNGAAGAVPFSLPTDDTDKTRYYSTKFQGSPVILKTGDKYTPYVPARPGNAWQGFMAFLANMIVLSTGLPPSLLLPIDIGGTDIRRDLQVGQRVVEILQSEFADDLQLIAEYFIKGGIEDRAFRSKIPADWNALEWHFTGSLTVDRNRDADRRDAVMDGLLSRDEYFGELAQDEDEQMQKIVDEVKRNRQRITGIPFETPFKDAADFKQYLSLRMESRQTIAEPMPPEGAPKPNPGKTAAEPALA